MDNDCTYGLYLIEKYRIGRQMSDINAKSEKALLDKRAYENLLNNSEQFIMSPRTKQNIAKIIEQSRIMTELYKTEWIQYFDDLTNVDAVMSLYENTITEIDNAEERAYTVKKTSGIFAKLFSNLFHRTK